MLKAYAWQSDDHLYVGMINLLSAIGADITVLVRGEPASSFHYLLTPFSPHNQWDLPTTARILRLQWERPNRFLLVSPAIYCPKEKRRAQICGLDVARELGSLLRKIAGAPPRLSEADIARIVEDGVREQCRKAAHDLQGSSWGERHIRVGRHRLKQAIERGLWIGAVPEEPHKLAAALAAAARGKLP